MFDFCFQITKFFYLSYNFCMNRILTTVLLGLLIVEIQSCAPGQLKIADICTPIQYIPGCLQYISKGSCSICQYGYLVTGNGKCQYTEKPTSQCCILIGSIGTCIQCAPGLYLDGNKCYKIERPGCLERGKGQQCINCATGYTNIQGRCLKKIKSCKKLDGTGICIECQSGYQVIRGHCSEIISTPRNAKCRQSNQYGCQACQLGYYLTKNRTCRLNQAGCLKHYREACQICSPQYKLLNGKCIMEGCSDYNISGCTKCSQPYQFKQGKCIIDNCLQSLDGKCLLCHSDYRIKNGRCVKPIADRCSSCANGYFIGQDSKCYKNIGGCSTYSLDGKCSQCVEPFVTFSGFCVILGCDKYDFNGCITCVSPFFLSSGKCFLDNCQQHNYQSRRCRTCKLGYHIERGICVKNDQLCRAYSFINLDQICVRCTLDDYILTDNGVCEIKKPGCVYQYGKCISCASPFKRNKDSTCFIEGCAQHQMDGCTRCNLPYLWNLGACIILSCDQIRDGQCIRCASGLRLTQKGECQQNDPKCLAYKGYNCQKCIEGFRLNSQNLCVRMITNCRVQNSHQCTQCQTGYRLLNGNCIISDRFCLQFDQKLQGCVKCAHGYYTQSGICRLNNPNCDLYQQLGNSQKCIKCAEGFVFPSEVQLCIKQILGCNYDKNGVCISCKSPFTFNGTSCIIYGCSNYSDLGCYQCVNPSQKQGYRCIIPFCEIYQNGFIGCQKCSADYKMTQGRCFRENSKCIEYSKSGQCTSCSKQFIIFQGVCLKKDPQCSVYSKKGRCNKCKDRYYLTPDLICLPEQPGCVYKGGKCTFCNYPFKFFEPTQKCRIDGCLQTYSAGCLKCKFPYRLNNLGICEIDNCVNIQENSCVRCSPGYHLKQGLNCAKDEKSCLKYNDNGDCQLCDKGYLQMNSGECQIAEDNCIKRSKYSQQCLFCKKLFFLNKFYQCEKRDKNCEEYNNGDCVDCTRRFFLYQSICFPQSPGCVSYNGKDCIKCKTSYTLKNGECFNLKKPLLQFQGQDQKYDFDITPFDITKSKYYIDNLSPVSKLGKVYFSSFFNKQYTDARLVNEEQNLFPKGWKSKNARTGEYIGYTIKDQEPVTFYAIQLQGIEGNYIQQFQIEYALDGINFIRIEKIFNSQNSGKNLTTIYFTGIYAKSIRIIIKSFYRWPATRIQFFYYDLIRFRKLSNLKSLKYLKQAIYSNFVDRMNNQMYINQRFFFNPSKVCQDKSVCFTGLELCQERTINSLKIGITEGGVKKIYITYSIDGQNFNCFENCRHLILNEKQNESTLNLNGLLAKNLRVYPLEWTGSPNIKIAYDYS